MTKLPPPLPRAGRIKTRIIVVAWTASCVTMGMMAEAWWSVEARRQASRIIERRVERLAPINPVLRWEYDEPRIIHMGDFLGFPNRDICVLNDAIIDMRNCR
jgi:hypothetical protein